MINAMHALADPTRRDIFERIWRTPSAVGRLATQMPVSRPAVSQHLAVLKQAGLVQDQRKGTERIYSIDRRGLLPLRTWLEQFWDEALESFAAQVEMENQKEKSGSKQ